MSLVECEVYESGWAAEKFYASGEELAVKMIHFIGTESNDDGPEEMIALLEGEIELNCDGEKYSLAAGQGILIPAGVSRLLHTKKESLLYRVHKK